MYLLRVFGQYAALFMFNNVINALSCKPLKEQLLGCQVLEKKPLAGVHPLPAGRLVYVDSYVFHLVNTAANYLPSGNTCKVSGPKSSY